MTQVHHWSEGRSANGLVHGGQRCDQERCNSGTSRWEGLEAGLCGAYCDLVCVSVCM